MKPVDLEHLLVLTGSVGYDENHLLQVASNVRGRVAAIPVDLGAWVRKGDALLVLESVELGKAREEFLRETSTLRVGHARLRTREDLVAAKAISSGRVPGPRRGVPVAKGRGRGRGADAPPPGRQRTTKSGG